MKCVYTYQVTAFKEIKSRNLIENETLLSLSTEKSGTRRKQEEMDTLESLKQQTQQNQKKMV